VTRASPLTDHRADIAVDEAGEGDLRYYGWKVVLAAGLGVMVGFGSLFVYTFSVFLKPLSAQFGWSREAISAGFGLAAVTVGVCSPVLGRALDRFPPRRIILPCMAAFCAGFASLAFLHSHLWQFYGTCILLGIVGNGAAHLAYSRSIVTWFHSRLGMAFACVMAGSGLGSMVLPFVAQTFIGHWGWRVAYFLLGMIALAIGIPTGWKYIYEQSGRVPGVSSPQLPGLTWRQGVVSVPFWIIIIALVLNSAAVNGVLAHLSALLTDRGISADRAALGLAVLGATSLAGRLVVGGMLDRFRGSWVAFFTLMPGAAGILLLSKAVTLTGACAGAGLIGMGMGAEADITPYLLKRHFGVQSFSTLYGFTWTFYAFAAATGPILMGYAFDSTGSYTSILMVLALCVGLAATSMLLLPPYPAPQ
jgi:cyanate permease